MKYSPSGWTTALVRAQSTIMAAAMLFALQVPVGLITSTSSAAKTPGKTYCFHGHCHTVRTLEQTRAAVGSTTTVKTSFYSDPKQDRFNPSNVTSSGEWFRSDRADNAASPIWPDGTKLLLWNPANKRSAVVRVNNAGPYWGSRSLDVSRAAADKLGFLKSGVASLQAKVIAAPSKEESTYKKGRQYASVPGFLGVFESIDKALFSVGSEFQKILTPAGRAVASAPAVVKAKRTKVAAAG
jgi:rare lipoprotein A